jgi:hypothetical protein
MGANARTQGANARQIDWDQEQSRSTRRTGSWMPLEALDEDDHIYAATPQLQAVAAPSRQIAVPHRTAQQEVAPTRSQPRVSPLDRAVPTRSVAMVAGIALTALVAYVVLSAAIQWVQVKIDDMQYGRPRTMQIDAYVGHNEADGVPSHFVAMNLNRRVTIIEMQGSDPTKINTIIGPYLFGQGEDLAPVQISAQDLNGDNKADLIVSVNNEQLFYLNDGASFKLATPEERAAIEKSLATNNANKGGTSGPGAIK